MSVVALVRISVAVSVAVSVSTSVSVAVAVAVVIETAVTVAVSVSVAVSVAVAVVVGVRVAVAVAVRVEVRIVVDVLTTVRVRVVVVTARGSGPLMAGRRASFARTMGAQANLVSSTVLSPDVTVEFDMALASVHTGLPRAPFASCRTAQLFSTKFSTQTYNEQDWP